MKASRLKTHTTIFFLGALIGISSCHNAEKQSVPDTALHPDSLKYQLEEAHRELSKHEEKIIDQYVKRHELNLKRTASGLMYTVYRTGEGTNARKGDIVRIHYSIGLINGIEAYSTLNGDPEEIMIEKSEAVSGMHELLQYMNQGAKARAIIPSYLAYGLTGDQERIPKGATLIIDIELLQVISTNQ
ncbi:MAG: FKBP-type peptidyl-prolyl cis-trans isomerase [Bacteroidales bacterium]